MDLINFFFFFLPQKNSREKKGFISAIKSEELKGQANLKQFVFSVSHGGEKSVIQISLFANVLRSF